MKVKLIICFNKYNFFLLVYDVPVVVDDNTVIVNVGEYKYN